MYCSRPQSVEISNDSKELLPLFAILPQIASHSQSQPEREFTTIIRQVIKKKSF
jgi:hypothetical protein